MFLQSNSTRLRVGDMYTNPIKYLPFIIAILMIIAPVQADSIPIPNHSFEVPAINPIENPFLAIPFTSSWTEDDIDSVTSLNTGTFANTPPDSNDHLVNPDGSQLAFLGGMDGNALWQYLPVTYQVGKSYRLTIGVCGSANAPLPQGSILILALHYLYVSAPADIVSVQIPAPPSTSRTIEDFSVTIPTVQPGDLWAGRNIGIAIRGTGAGGGFWDIDNIRLIEYPRTPEFTGDSFVNLSDFVKMAAEWQSCSEPETDITGDGCVNLEDFMILIEYWLRDV